MNKLRIVFRVFAIDQYQSFVTAVDERFDFVVELWHGERFSAHFFVGAAEAAVLAVIDAFVADVERREEYDTVAVDPLFKLARAFKNFFDQFRVFGIDQGRHLLRIESVFIERLLDNLPHPFRGRRFRVFQCLENLILGDEAF